MKNNSLDVFPPGSIIGIMGGGQLGRMTALAAANLGYRCHIYTEETDSPAAQVSATTTVASYKDNDALTQFAKSVDLITYEFENIPMSSITLLNNIRSIRPSPSILEISQHRGKEKDGSSADWVTGGGNAGELYIEADPISTSQTISKSHFVQRRSM